MTLPKYDNVIKNEIFIKIILTCTIILKTFIENRLLTHKLYKNSQTYQTLYIFLVNLLGL